MKYLLVLLLLVANKLYAQDLSVKYSMDRESISLDEVLKYRILVTGSFKTTPALHVPELQNFKIISNRKMSKVSISAGEIVSSVEFIFMLSPLKEGFFEMSGFKVEAGDVEYEVEAIKIKVSGSKDSILPKEDNDGSENSEEKIWL
ncbi:MAG: BatD family protein [Candidatus Kaelpia imicola]|nr:BatD family protein [Candidatus Kaelpia imicola]